MTKTRLSPEEKEQLAIDNQNLVYYMVNKFSNLPNSYEDKLSAGMLGMAKALNAFDPSKNIKLTTFVGTVITNEILLMSRRERKHGNNVSIETVVFKDKAGAEIRMIDALKAPESEWDWRDINDSVQTVVKTLKPRDQDIFTEFMKGKRNWEIAQEQNLSSTTVGKVITKTLEKVKLDYWGNSVSERKAAIKARRSEVAE